MYLEPGARGPTLLVGRPEGGLSVNPAPRTHARLSLRIYGIMGLVQTLSGPHLLVITERRSAGLLLGHPLWAVAQTRLLPCATAAQAQRLSSAPRADDDRYVRLIKHFIASTGIYYSAHYDLTRTLQAQAYGQAGFELDRVSPRFFLNRHIAEPLLAAHRLSPASEAHQFLAVCIEGFVRLQPTTVNGRRLSFGIVSRRATGRVGTRHFSRGVDDAGNVSNYVETEQLVFSGQAVGAHVQVRGSIPVYWRQTANLYYKPPMELYHDAAANAAVFRRHFAELQQQHGDILAINLVDQTGFEGTLARQYVRHIDELQDPRIKYVHFDFHQNCRNMQWHHIARLMDNVEAQLRQQGHYTATLQDARVLSEQTGVVRTNCVDCLDRTNVVQSVIGQRILNEQLHELGVFAPRESLADHADLVWFFKNIWADNGDAISAQYAGTGALKSDYTRTGRRTAWGALQDGFKSAVRYHRSNFSDGHRQDAMDLFHGRFVVSPTGLSPFQAMGARAAVSPAGLLGSILLLGYAASWLLAHTSLGTAVPRLLHVPLVLLPGVLLTAAALRHGALFVQYPRLVPPTHLTIKARPLPEADEATSLFGKVHVI